MGEDRAGYLAAFAADARAPLDGDRELAENAPRPRAARAAGRPAGRPGGAPRPTSPGTATRVGLARRFYNDAVRDTRALRRRRLPRLLRLHARRPLPRYFDIDDRLRAAPSRSRGAVPPADPPYDGVSRDLRRHPRQHPVARTQTPVPRTGTDRVKRGMAEQLKGGVIMDVVTPEQAKIAEDAGAVAVMALERVPADIRVQGGIARMSDPDMIEGIIGAVTIPVMAKARIGHFVEAQVLQALGVDYIDESEVLTPADEAHHIAKCAFTVPFVCGATDLGEALRRIAEGAAMIRSKGEAGTGNVVEATRHMRAIRAGIRRLGTLDETELFVAAKELRAPYDLVAEVARLGKLPVVLFTAGGIATPADAAMMMQLGAEGVFVGSGIFKSGDPAQRAAAIVQATTFHDDPDVIAKVSRGPGRADGRHQRLDAARERAVRHPRLVTPGGPAAARTAIEGGIAGLDLARGLAVLGMFGAHLRHRRRADHRRPAPAGRPSSTAARRSCSPRSRASRSRCCRAAPARGRRGRSSGPGCGSPSGRPGCSRSARVLEWLDTFVAIILGVYAVLFVLALPFLRWPPRRLLARRRASSPSLGPPLVAVPRPGPARSADAESHYVAELLVTGTYPAMLWLAFVLVGLAVGRLDLGAAACGRGWPAPAAAAAVLGYAGGWLSTRALAGGLPSAGPEDGLRLAGGGVGRRLADRRRAAQRHDLRAGRVVAGSPSW